MVNYNFSLKWMFIVSIFLVLAGFAGGFFTGRASVPMPTSYVDSIVVETKVPEVDIQIADIGNAEEEVLPEIPDLSEIDKMETVFVKNDSIYRKEFLIEESGYSGRLKLFFSSKSKRFAYGLKIKSDPVVIVDTFEVEKVEYVQFVNKTKWLYRYIDIGAGYDFVEPNEKEDSFYPDFAVLSLGVAIKKTVPIYFQINTNGLLSLHIGLIF